mmetsp:Transcript_40922/g.65792  ORF Transcript_40922/g.65792 Transcript_40922/m.65792 type:complete len:227 (-) Transcript_40922:199-879(-)
MLRVALSPNSFFSFRVSASARFSLSTHSALTLSCSARIPRTSFCNMLFSRLAFTNPSCNSFIFLSKRFSSFVSRLCFLLFFAFGDEYPEKASITPVPSSSSSPWISLETLPLLPYLKWKSRYLSDSKSPLVSLSALIFCFLSLTMEFTRLIPSSNCISCRSPTAAKTHRGITPSLLAWEPLSTERTLTSPSEDPTSVSVNPNGRQRSKLIAFMGLHEGNDAMLTRQ